MKSFTDDQSIIVKMVDNGSCAVVWERNDYIVKMKK